jgi:hypothetical protein
MASKSASERGIGFRQLTMNRICFRCAEKSFFSARRRGFQTRALAAAVSTVLCLGCTPAAKSSPAVTSAFEAMPQPVRVGVVTVDFTLTDARSRPVTGAHLTTEADMTHAGMSPVFGSVQEKQPGRYESVLDLGMVGDWVILLHGTLPTGEKIERQFELRNVRPKDVQTN